MALDVLAERIGAGFRLHKARAAVAEGRIAPGATKIILAKPASFMNLSGGPVAALLKFYSLDASRLIVLHDELDLPFDTVRLKQGGGHGGHNGLRDISAAAGPDYTRVRIGIGRPPGRQDAADFVLKPFSSTERAALPNLLADAADATEDLVTLGLLDAQQKWRAPRA